MRSVEEIIERASRLSAKDRRRVLDALKPRAKRTRAAAPRSRRKPRELYGSLLQLAGSGHSNVSDIASDKYRYLAEAYGDTRDE